MDPKKISQGDEVRAEFFFGNIAAVSKSCPSSMVGDRTGIGDTQDLELTLRICLVLRTPSQRRLSQRALTGVEKRNGPAFSPARETASLDEAANLGGWERALREPVAGGGRRVRGPATRMQEKQQAGSSLTSCRRGGPQSRLKGAEYLRHGRN